MLGGGGPGRLHLAKLVPLVLDQPPRAKSLLNVHSIPCQRLVHDIAEQHLEEPIHVDLEHQLGLLRKVFFVQRRCLLIICLRLPLSSALAFETSSHVQQQVQSLWEASLVALERVVDEVRQLLGVAHVLDQLLPAHQVFARDLVHHRLDRLGRHAVLDALGHPREEGVLAQRRQSSVALTHAQIRRSLGRDRA